MSGAPGAKWGGKPGRDFEGEAGVTNISQITHGVSARCLRNGNTECPSWCLLCGTTGHPHGAHAIHLSGNVACACSSFGKWLDQSRRSVRFNPSQKIALNTTKHHDYNTSSTAVWVSTGLPLRPHGGPTGVPHGSHWGLITPEWGPAGVRLGSDWGPSGILLPGPHWGFTKGPPGGLQGSSWGPTGVLAGSHWGPNAGARLGVYNGPGGVLLGDLPGSYWGFTGVLLGSYWGSCWGLRLANATSSADDQRMRKATLVDNIAKLVLLPTESQLKMVVLALAVLLASPLEVELAGCLPNHS